MTLLHEHKYRRLLADSIRDTIYLTPVRPPRVRLIIPLCIELDPPVTCAKIMKFTQESNYFVRTQCEFIKGNKSRKSDLNSQWFYSIRSALLQLKTVSLVQNSLRIYIFTEGPGNNNGITFVLQAMRNGSWVDLFTFKNNWQNSKEFAANVEFLDSIMAMRYHEPSPALLSLIRAPEELPLEFYRKYKEKQYASEPFSLSLLKKIILPVVSDKMVRLLEEETIDTWAGLAQAIIQECKSDSQNWLEHRDYALALSMARGSPEMNLDAIHAYEKARYYLQRSTENNPAAIARLSLYQAAMYKRRKRYAMSFTCLREAEQELSNDLIVRNDIYYNLGTLTALMGDEEQALRYLLPLLIYPREQRLVELHLRDYLKPIEDRIRPHLHQAT